MSKNFPLCRWCNQPADGTCNLVRNAEYYEHPDCALLGIYLQVEAINFPGIKSLPQPAPADHQADMQASFDYLLDPDPYPGPSATSILCSECSFFPPIPNSQSQLCRYCTNDFNSWLIERQLDLEETQQDSESEETWLPRQSDTKTCYLVITYQLVEVA
jgi:hypothetical protein